jgi:hypothetical protein
VYVFCAEIACDNNTRHTNDSVIFRAILSPGNIPKKLFIFNSFTEDTGQFLETVWCFDALKKEKVLKIENILT